MPDPTYMIRAIPSNASDNVCCTLLAQSAVHGVMAGYTGFTVGLVNGRHTYIPFNVSYYYISSHKFQIVLLSVALFFGFTIFFYFFISTACK